MPVAFRRIRAEPTAPAEGAEKDTNNPTQTRSSEGDQTDRAADIFDSIG